VNRFESFFESKSNHSDCPVFLCALRALVVKRVLPNDSPAQSPIIGRRVPSVIATIRAFEPFTEFFVFIREHSRKLADKEFVEIRGHVNCFYYSNSYRNHAPKLTSLCTHSRSFADKHFATHAEFSQPLLK
jgi:hypothetical protein